MPPSKGIEILGWVKFDAERSTNNYFYVFEKSESERFYFFLLRICSYTFKPKKYPGHSCLKGRELSSMLKSDCKGQAQNLGAQQALIAFHTLVEEDPS